MDDNIFLELEKNDPSMYYDKCMEKYILISNELIERYGKQDIFKLLKYLYTLIVWTLPKIKHEERKKIIIEMLEDIDSKLLDNLIEVIHDKKLYTKRTYFKRARYALKKLFCNFRE